MTYRPALRTRPDAAEIGKTVLTALLFGTAASLIHRTFRPSAAESISLPNRPIRPVLPEPAEQRHETPPAGSPADVPVSSWWDILKRTFGEVSSDRVLAVAGGVTFYALLSVFPAITVMVSAYGLFTDPATVSDHLQMLSKFLPEGAMSIIGEQVQRITNGDHTQLGVAAIAGFFVALWSSNAAMKAMMDALNVAYDVDEQRSFVWLTLESLFFTLSSIIGLIVMLAVIALVPFLLHTLPIGPGADTLISVGRWPLAFILVVVALAVLYKFGPSRPEAPWRWITPGSVAAAIGLMVLSMTFSWYAANFAKYNETYGSLGAAIGFMTWLWLSATIVLVGAELNSEIEKTARAEPGHR